MTTGGNVPHQGTTTEALSDAKQQQLAQEKKRGTKGEVGTGTPGSRVKDAWQDFNYAAGAPKNMISLKAFARAALKDKQSGPGWPENMAPLQANVEEWLTSKGAGTPEQRAARKKRLKERRSSNVTAKLGRKSKGKQQKKVETSRDVD